MYINVTVAEKMKLQTIKLSEGRNAILEPKQWILIFVFLSSKKQTAAEISVTMVKERGFFFSLYF